MYLSDKNNGSNLFTLSAPSATSGVKYDNFFWKLNRSNDSGEVSVAIFDWLCFLLPTNLSFTMIPSSNENMKGEMGVRVNKSLISALPSLYLSLIHI